MATLSEVYTIKTTRLPQRKRLEESRTAEKLSYLLESMMWLSQKHFLEAFHMGQLYVP